MKQHARLSSGMRLYVAAIAAFIALPQLLVVAVAFSSASFVSFPPPGYSLRWMVQVLGDATFMRGLLNSVILGLAASAASTVLAIPAAIALVRGRPPGAIAIQAFLLSPLSLPTLILAIGLLFFLSFIGLGNTYLGLMIGHMVITLPYLVRTLVAYYAATDPSIEEAALTLGAPPWATLCWITLPMMRSAVVAGGMLAFLISFDDVAIALLLTNARSMTLPVAILGYLTNNYDPAVAAISVVKMLLVVSSLLLVERFYGLQNLTIASRNSRSAR